MPVETCNLFIVFTLLEESVSEIRCILGLCFFSATTCHLYMQKKKILEHIRNKWATLKQP